MEVSGHLHDLQFTPEKTSPGTHRITGWLCLWRNLHAVEKYLVPVENRTPIRRMSGLLSSALPNGLTSQWSHFKKINPSDLQGSGFSCSWADVLYFLDRWISFGHLGAVFARHNRIVSQKAITYFNELFAATRVFQICYPHKCWDAIIVCPPVLFLILFEKISKSLG
jgi:hypothetical protein